MGTLFGLAQIVGTIYIFYNAWKGTPKKLFMKNFCIITGILFSYIVIRYWVQGETAKMLYFSVDLILTLLIPFVAKSFEKINKR